jgi:GMP synthase (glutamine-hydrolysing)
MKSRDELKILLLQIREDEETMLEEYYSFVQFSGLKSEQIDKLNVFTNRHFEPHVIDGYDALFIGGSSDATVRDEDENDFVPACKSLIRYCYVKNIPVFASCFGFQLAMKEMGSEIIIDKENMEIGIHEVTLTDMGQKDKLLSGYPSTFFVVSGHKERAKTIPSGTELLAKSDKCPYHLVKFKGKPFYCSQFHPEVDRTVLISRITRYQDKYLDDANELQKIIDEATHDTPYSNDLLKHFISRIVLDEKSEQTSADESEHISNTMMK